MGDHASGTRDYEFSACLRLCDGYMYCEGVRMCDVQKAIQQMAIHPPSPVFVYSKATLLQNIAAYQHGLAASGTTSVLGYAIKANYNPAVLTLVREMGCTAIAVSGNELQLALDSGFTPRHLVLNGNGKLPWEISLAIKHGCLINVDSAFDLRHLSDAARTLQTRAHILLRLNPDIDAKVHPFLATGLASSKFGIEDSRLEALLDQIHGDPWIELVGLHCHLGSTIDNTDVFSECVEVMIRVTESVEARGFPKLLYINLGGGLGISYRQHAHRTARPGDERQTQPAMPTPQQLISSVVQEKLAGRGLCLILEPGRSLIGSAVTLVTKVIGCKRNKNTNYMVVDGSMNEVIRPSLYGAYHHIELTEPPHTQATGTEDSQTINTDASHIEQVQPEPFDVVGPICECADFLGKERWLPRPHEGCGVAVFDAGAYCGSMATNYNLRLRPVEVMVDGSEWHIIRYPDNMADIMKSFTSASKMADNVKPVTSAS